MAVVIYRNARIYTGAPDGTAVEAIAVEDGHVAATGSQSQVRQAVADRGAAEMVDLEGACVIPGLYDAHIHTAQVARGLATVDVRSCGDLQQALDRIGDFSAGLAEDRWVTGGRWDSNRWSTRRQPDRHALDSVCPTRPAVLPSIDGHTVWANSAALAAAGITRDTPDPVGGEIERDADGEPTGILREAAAESLRQMATEHDTRDLADLLDDSQRLFLSQGITSVMDLDGEDARAAYLQLRDTGRLAIRVHKAIPVDALELAIDQGRQTGDGDDWVRTGPVKLFSDGALGSHTCHMTEPFTGTSNTGMAVTPYAELQRLVRAACQAGIAVATHAIGDHAAHLVLDAYEAAHRTAGGPSRLRHRIEHAQHLRPDDIERMARLGVVASMQPTHCTSDIDLVDSLLGARDVASYAWRSLLDAGVAVAFGSDAPVEDSNPFDGLYAATTRTRPDGTPPGGWQPEQRLGVIEALSAYTHGSAYAAGEQARKGTLAPGMLADLVAIDTDLTASPDALRRAQVLTTVVAGVVRWQR